MNEIRLYLFFIALLIINLFIGCQSSTSEHWMVEKSMAENEEYWQKQIVFMTQLLSKKPRETEYYYRRAKFYVKLNQLDKAFEDIQIASQIQTQIADYFLLKAEILKKIGNKEKELFEAAIEAEKLGCQSPELWTILGKYYLEDKKLTISEDYLKKSFNLIPQNTEVLYYLGRLHQNLSDTAQAISYFKQVIQQDAQYLPAYLSLMQIFNQYGLYSQSLFWADSASKKNKTNAEYAYLLAYSLERSPKIKSDSVIYWYNQSTSLDSTYWKSYEGLANLYSSQKKYDLVIPLLEKSATQQDKPIDTYLQLGKLFEHKINNYSKAKQFYEQAYQLDTTRVEVLESRNRVEKKIIGVLKRQKEEIPK
jgi:tetratricopeptide (TPR) repeat protein